MPATFQTFLSNNSVFSQFRNIFFTQGLGASAATVVQTCNLTHNVYKDLIIAHRDELMENLGEGAQDLTGIENESVMQELVKTFGTACKNWR